MVDVQGLDAQHVHLEEEPPVGHAALFGNGARQVRDDGERGDESGESAGYVADGVVRRFGEIRFARNKVSTKLSILIVLRGYLSTRKS